MKTVKRQDRNALDASSSVKRAPVVRADISDVERYTWQEMLFVLKRHSSDCHGWMLKYMMMMVLMRITYSSSMFMSRAKAGQEK